MTIRVPLIAAGLMVLVGVVASHQVMSVLGGVQEDRLRELARLHVDALTVALGPAVLRRDVWEVYDTLDRATQALAGRRMVLTVVADEEGRVIAASDPFRAPVDSALDPFLADVQTLEGLSLAGDDDHIRLQADLRYQGRKAGQILLELNVADLVAERRRMLLLLLLGNALATAALATSGYVVVRRMLRPVSALSAHISSSGNTPQAIPEERFPKGDQELTRLFQNYNTMSNAALARAEAERRLAERERFVSLGRLSSSLAHEINNPLGGLLNATDTLRTYADRPDVVRDAAALLDRGLRHLRDVTRATLDHNRQDRQGLPLTPEDFDDLRVLFEPETLRQGQGLSWETDLPPSILLAWPAAPIRQVVLNLLLNAATAAGAGGKVSLTIALKGNMLELVVSDSGPGLDQAAQARLLSDDPVQPGGGVGLRLVRELVRGQDGSVAYARVREQTEIRVLLPAKGQI
ncbi:HAMP domain-containing sensor histidine kinase [Paracoccus sp. SY]|uniref:sensor histidine kinase n=1 Tax=Paracoccus sp. SY TaxID=1330255 RepID=UPI001EFD9F8B|nr:HAMP domain-containing sensor histidine kinase [Paracoccus sp. SY]